MLKKPTRNSDDDDARGRVSTEYSWDFAIPWKPGWHVTIFPLGLLAAAIPFVIVVAAILVAVIWFLS